MSSLIYKARAPLRLGLAGGGTDVNPYSSLFGGAIVNCTIDLFATATVSSCEDDLIVFASIDQDKREVYKVSCSEIPTDGPLALAKATYNYLKNLLQFKHQPLEVTIQSEVPMGSGLGSSSTCTVALVSALSSFLNSPISQLEIAKLALDIERNYLGVEGGKQDHYSATHGGINFMEFHRDGHVEVTPLSLEPETLKGLQNSLILYFSNSSRKSSNIIKEQIKNVESNNMDSIEAMHELKSQAYEMRELLLRQEMSKFPEVLHKGWRSKKAMAHGITNSKIDNILDQAIWAGAASGKVSGAGGGGFVLLYCDPKKRDSVIQLLNKMDGYVQSFNFEKNGVTIWQEKRIIGV